MDRSSCLLAGLLIGFAVLQPRASIAQPYDPNDPRPDIVRRQIRAIGAGFVGYVKSATADTVTVTSDGSYSVIPKGTEYTFLITPATQVFHMREDGEFKPPDAWHGTELRAADFVGVNYDDRGVAHIALRIYTLPPSIAGQPPTGPAVAPTCAPRHVACDAGTLPGRIRGLAQKRAGFRRPVCGSRPISDRRRSHRHLRQGFQHISQEGNSVHIPPHVGHQSGE